MREIKHKPYYCIPAYQILSKKTDEDMANILGITVRTYKDKIAGYSDFSFEQGRILSAVFRRTQEEIFLT